MATSNQTRRGAKLQDRTGKRYGRLTVIEFVGMTTHSNWLCLCDCGNEVIVLAPNFARTKSCGCLHRDKVTTHGMSSSGEYVSWKAMRRRCYDTEWIQYKDYGGRGITVCDRWRDSFENFLTDMGPRPSPAHTLDRKENDGNYEPGNCRWATRLEQTRNRRCTKR